MKDANGGFLSARTDAASTTCFAVDAFISASRALGSRFASAVDIKARGLIYPTNKLYRIGTFFDEKIACGI